MNIRRITSCLVIAAAAAVFAWTTTTIPNYLAPCHGFMHGDPYRMVASFSAYNPISAGFWSAVSLDIWPAHGYFAMPEYCTAADYGHGLPIHWYNQIVVNAFPAFHVSRTFFTAIFAFILSYLLWGLVVYLWSAYQAASRSTQTPSSPS